MRGRATGEGLSGDVIRLALSVIGVAYAILALVVVLFAVNLGRPVDIGVAYFAAVMLGWGMATSAAGLFAGSVLGTLALVRHTDTRRPLYVLGILGGWIGALVLGWFAWEFWTNSSLPKVAP